MICPHCESTNWDPIGYSMFDITFLCFNCDREFEQERNNSTEHYVKEINDYIDRENSLP